MRKLYSTLFAGIASIAFAFSSFGADREVYVVGGVVYWDTALAVKMDHTEGTNVYTLTSDYLFGETWKLCDGSWDWNFGGNGDNILVGNQDNEAWFNGGNFNGVTGNVTVTFILVEGSEDYDSPIPSIVRVSTTGEVIPYPENPEPVPRKELYVRGGMNDWGALPEWRFTYNNDFDIYTFRCEGDKFIPGETEFKFADANWGEWHFGAGGSTQYVPFDEYYELNNGFDPANMKFHEDFYGTLRVWFEHGYIPTFYAEYDPTLAGISAPSADGAEAEYFNLQGVKVANPEKGIFIRIINGHPTKVRL